ncbi:hypothetical protein CcaverHIS002_0409130 [Cutaneotrichosporon cavernicola]|nr:hypothetical protein CcaverHIS002_0409130 [Cutaneotrichosporon cavernicola]
MLPALIVLAAVAHAQGAQPLTTNDTPMPTDGAGQPGQACLRVSAVPVPAAGIVHDSIPTGLRSTLPLDHIPINLSILLLPLAFLPTPSPSTSPLSSLSASTSSAPSAISAPAIAAIILGVSLALAGAVIGVLLYRNRSLRRRSAWLSSVNLNTSPTAGPWIPPSPLGGRLQFASPPQPRPQVRKTSRKAPPRFSGIEMQEKSL